MRLLLADDHAVVRRGLQRILEEGMPGTEFGEAADGPGAVARASEGSWDIVVLDLNLPGKSGLEVLKEIRSLPKPPPVLILSVHPEEQYAIRALRAGAHGYLNKDSAPELLLEAVRRILRGGRFLTPAVSDRLATEIQAPTATALHEALSDREFQVLCRIAQGRTVSQIADELALSVKTVSTYRARILEKMGMETNAELMHYAIQNHLVD